MIRSVSIGGIISITYSSVLIVGASIVVAPPLTYELVRVVRSLPQIVTHGMD